MTHHKIPPRELAQRVQLLRTTNGLKKLRKLRKYTEAVTTVEETLNSRLLRLPIQGRSFRVDDLRIGSRCHFVLFLDDSDPIYFDFAVREPAEDVGHVPIPGLCKLIIYLRDSAGNPLPTDGEMWCVNTRIATHDRTVFARRRGLYFNDERNETFTGFWLHWGESYVLGMDEKVLQEKTTIQVPSGSRYQAIELTESIDANPTSHRTQVFAGDGSPVSTAHIETTGCSGKHNRNLLRRLRRVGHLVIGVPKHPPQCPCPAFLPRAKYRLKMLRMLSFSVLYNKNNSSSNKTMGAD